MAKLTIKGGVADRSVYVFIGDATSPSGAGLTGLVYNSSGLTCYYVRPLGSATQLALATQTVGGAHSDGGFVEVSATDLPGVYRLDLSDAISAAGVESVAVMLKGAANMVPLLLELGLIGYDPTKPTGIIRAATAQGGDATHIQLDAGASAIDDAYNQMWVILVGGVGEGQARVIDDYVGATQQALVATWTTTPNNTTKFIVAAT